MILDEIHGAVLEACRQPTNVLTPAFYEEHIRVVSDCAAALAKRLGADPEIVELAALLHDYSAIVDFASLPSHAARSAELGRAMLVELGYPADRAAAVAAAIACHTSPLAVGAASPEEVCISNADAMAQIARPGFWLFFAFRVRRLGYEEGHRWYAERVRQGWEALIPDARELLAERHGQVAGALAPLSF